MRHLLFAAVSCVLISPATAQLQSVPVYSTAFPVAGFRYEPFVRHEGDTIHVAVIETTVTVQLPPLTYPMMYLRSADRGRTWAPAVNLGTSNNPTNPMAAFAGSGPRLYAFLGSSFVRSADDGITWQTTPNPTGLWVAAAQAAGQQCHVLLVAPPNASGPRAVAHVRTMDGGTTWSTPQSLGTSTLGVLPQLILDGTRLHVFWIEGLGYRTRYQRSTDSGATWLATPTLLGTGYAQRDQFAVSGSHVHLLRTSSPVEYVRSTDRGASWLPPLTAATPFAQVAQMTVAGTNVYLLLEGPVFGLPGLVLLRSGDDGATWAGSSLSSNQPIGGRSIQARGNQVCAAWSAPAHTIGISADAGATWQTHPGSSGWAGVGGYDSPRIALRPPAVHVCWLGQGYLGPPLVWYPTDIDVSGDSGATWHLRQQFGTPWSSGPAQFLGTDDASGFLWSDGGSSIGSPVYPTNLHYGTIYGHERFGPSKPGTGGIAPRLLLAGGPWLGNTVTVTLTETVGGAIAMLGASFAGEANTPLGSSVLLLATPAMGFWGIATGAAGLAGAGALPLPFAIPNVPTLHQQRVTFQGFALDGNAAEGFASTAGLTMVIL